MQVLSLEGNPLREASLLVLPEAGGRGGGVLDLDALQVVVLPGCGGGCNGVLSVEEVEVVSECGGGDSAVCVPSQAHHHHQYMPTSLFGHMLGPTAACLALIPEHT